MGVKPPDLQSVVLALLLSFGSLCCGTEQPREFVAKWRELPQLGALRLSLNAFSHDRQAEGMAHHRKGSHPFAVLIESGDEGTVNFEHP